VKDSVSSVISVCSVISLLLSEGENIMPMLLTDQPRNESRPVAAGLTAALVSRNCQLQPYQKITVPVFKVPGDFIAYASPDSTYAATRKLLDGAKKSILIGIYDFTALYMQEILLNALTRGVKVALMLDLDGVTGERAIFDKLAQFGCEAVPAPSCASKKARFFASSHEKVIVIDDAWTLVQSGNYSKNSIPFNEKDGGDPAAFVPGNRDMGVAIRSKPLAAFFTKVLRSDMKLELTAPAVAALRAERKPAPLSLLEAAPAKLPAKLFPSKRFNPPNSVTVRPVLTPDNYLDVVPGFLAAATKSILIEQQYIRGSQARVQQLLTAIRLARSQHPNLDVRIILGKIFSTKAEDLEKEKQNLKLLREEFGLKLGANIRYIDTSRFVHCHNKTIIVDNQAALVSSQNWSDTAVGTNREAGVIMEYPEVAQYYAAIFESDWETARKTLPAPGPAFIQPAAVPGRRLIEVDYGDYAEV
jgi:phosphatidylserine/phosphatidylglycerophosphate/cardiolipin synthase-like enzyme